MLMKTWVCLCSGKHQECWWLVMFLSTRLFCSFFAYPTSTCSFEVRAGHSKWTPGTQVPQVGGGAAGGGTDERKSVRSEFSCSGVILWGRITLIKPSSMVRSNFEVSLFHLDRIYFSNNWGFTCHLQKLKCNFAAGKFSPLRNSLIW